MHSDYICNLIIPGAAKSGTSSLHEYLDQHPLISMSSSKEPHHFCRNDRYAGGSAAHNSLFQEKSSVRYFGESSTGYLPWAPAAERIARDLHCPKVIIILRHPVSRCFSHFRWRYRLGLEKRSFLDAVKEDGFGYHPEKPSQFGYMAYLEFSQYSKQCPFWESTFGKENCLLLSSRELLGDQESTLARCLDFLDLPRIPAGKSSTKVNETSALGRRSPPAVTRLASLVPESFKSFNVYRKIKRGLLRSVAPNPPAVMTADERAYLEDILSEDIAWFDRRFNSPTGMVTDPVSEGRGIV